MKKILISFTFLIFIFSNLYSQKITILDSNFKSYLLSRTDSINTNKDSIITIQEASSFRGKFYLTSSNIQSLSGIEYFTELSAIFCNGNNISSIDFFKILI